MIQLLRFLNSANSQLRIKFLRCLLVRERGIAQYKDYTFNFVSLDSF